MPLPSLHVSPKVPKVVAELGWGLPSPASSSDREEDMWMQQKERNAVALDMPEGRHGLQAKKAGTELQAKRFKF